MKKIGEEMLEEIEQSDPSYQAEINYAVLQALAEENSPTLTVNEMNQWLDNVLAESV